MLTWRLFKWDANSYRHKFWDTQSSLFEAYRFFLNIKLEQSELNLPPQEKNEKGFKAILSQLCHLELNHFILCV